MMTDEKQTMDQDLDETLNECGCEGSCEADQDVGTEDEAKETTNNSESNDEANDDVNAESKEDGSSEDSEEEEAWQSKYTRLMADFQNYRKRTEKEKSDVYAYANEKVMTELLQVIDNFERALGQECQDEAYVEGMNLIFKQLIDVLEKSGLEEIEAEGREFDPNFHNAVLTDDNDQFESGQITAVMQKGYMVNSKVIRPSMVRVNN